MQELLTINQLAEALKVTRGTINNWRKQGMPCIQKDGARFVRFRMQEVMEWHERRNKPKLKPRDYYFK